MSRDEFLKLVSELLEEDVTGEERLEDLEVWDSMVVLEYIALVDEQFGLVVSADTLAQCETINDLVAMVGDKVQ